MNRLEIARSVYSKSGLQGSIDTTVGATGIQAAIVDYIDTVYNEVQLFRNEWFFRRAKKDVTVSPPDNQYEDEDIAIVDSILYNKRDLVFTPYDVFVRQTYQSGKPSIYSVDPSGAILFSPLSSNYVVTILYTRVPDVMTSNTDTPIIPLQFHMIIVYGTLVYLGDLLGNQSLIDTYTRKYDTIMGELMRSQLPTKAMRRRPLV